MSATACSTRSRTSAPSSAPATASIRPAAAIGIFAYGDRRPGHHRHRLRRLYRPTPSPGSDGDLPRRRRRRLSRRRLRRRHARRRRRRRHPDRRQRHRHGRLRRRDHAGGHRRRRRRRSGDGRRPARLDGHHGDRGHRHAWSASRSSTAPTGDILLVGSGGFTTIQAAIDAATDGDTILVAAGTYDEDLVIHVGVTILGAQAGEAVGRPRRRGRRRRDDDHRPRPRHGDRQRHPRRPALPQRRHHDRRRLGQSDPQFQTGGGATGHLVTNSIFWSTVAGGANGVDDRAISTQVLADGLITITDNLISGTSQGQFTTASWGRGIWFDGGGVDLVVTGNTIEWSRTGLNLDMSGEFDRRRLRTTVFRGPRHRHRARRRRRRPHRQRQRSSSGSAPSSASAT